MINWRSIFPKKSKPKVSGSSELQLVLQKVETGYALGTLPLEGGVDLHVEAIQVEVEEIADTGHGTSTEVTAVNPIYQDRIDSFEGVPELLERDGAQWFITAEPYQS